MEKVKETMTKLTIEMTSDQERSIFGEFDAYAKLIGKAFSVELFIRDGVLNIIGKMMAVKSR